MSDDSFIQEDDLAIIVRPIKKDGMWTGSIGIAIADMTNKTEEGDLNSVQLSQLLHLTAMIASSLPVMIGNDDVYTILDEYATAALSEVEEEEELDLSSQEDSVQVERKGNVYTLSFSSKTGGSA